MGRIVHVAGLAALLLVGVSFGPLPAAEMDSQDSLELNKISVFFPTGQTSLTNEAETLLDETVKAIADGRKFSLMIVGHTDRTGTEEINARIASERAESVEQGLVERGIDPGAIIVAESTGGRTTPGAPASFIGDRRADVFIEPETGLGF